MSVISYDPQSNQGTGALVLPEISGGTEIFLGEAISTELNEAGISLDATEALVSGMIFPYVQVTEGLSTQPFGSTPEARFKIGSLQYCPAVTIIRFENGSIQSNPICFNSHFLVYERQAIAPARFILNYPGSTVLDYEVTFDYPLDQNLDVHMFSPRLMTTGYQAPESACYLRVNFNQPIVANVKLYYVFELVDYQYYNDQRPLQIFFL